MIPGPLQCELSNSGCRLLFLICLSMEGNLCRGRNIFIWIILIFLPLEVLRSKAGSHVCTYHIQLTPLLKTGIRKLIGTYKYIFSRIVLVYKNIWKLCLIFQFIYLGALLFFLKKTQLSWINADLVLKSKNLTEENILYIWSTQWYLFRRAIIRFIMKIIWNACLILG